MLAAGVEGKTAVLVCTVRGRGDRLVSWIRRGAHPVVLSSGPVTFTSDTRVAVTNPPGSEDWVLSIAGARMGDRGHYECQVNTEPKINLGFWLNILRESSLEFLYFDIGPLMKDSILAPSSASPLSHLSFL